MQEAAALRSELARMEKMLADAESELALMKQRHDGLSRTGNSQIPPRWDSVRRWRR